MKLISKITAAAVSTGLIASTVAATTATAAPAPSWNKLPVVYVSGSNDLAVTAQPVVDAMRSAGLDAYLFNVWDPANPYTSPYLTVKGNSKRLAGFVDGVLKRTGSKKVDLVSYSQGGIVERYYLKDFGGASKTRATVIMSGMIKGSPFQTQAIKEGKCPPDSVKDFLPRGIKIPNPTPACNEMAFGGKEITALNSPSEALPGITYFNITSKQETDAAPYDINLMSGPGTYTNLITQDYCPNDPVFHLTMPHTPSVQSAVISALKTGKAKFTCMFGGR